MLEPDSRLLLIDNLRPPLGYTLDCAIGTTFSLDLLALMTAPVAFAMFDRQAADGSLANDAIATLEALRQHAKRITLFCQAGQISVPSDYRSLLVYLEDSVFQVTPPVPTRVFHPKIWMVRFRSANGDTQLRLLCLSRNLTFDRSWDTVLRLDGVRTEQNRYPELTRFVESLMTMSRGDRPMPEKRAAELQGLAADFARSDWELPSGFDAVRFHPLGLDGEPTWPFPPSKSRVLVISPFLSSGVISRLGKGATNAVVISRGESFDAIGATGTAAVNECLVPAPETEPAPEVDEVGPTNPNRLSGLHAKTFILDNTGSSSESWRSSVWTGSANATEAAFAGNIEFLVQLDGPWAKVGVSSVIGGDPPSKAAIENLRKILTPWTPPAEPVPPSEQEQLEERLDQIRRAIGSLHLKTACTEQEDRRWQLALTGIPTNQLLTHAELTGIAASIRPLSLMQGADQALMVSAEGIESNVIVTREAVTPWFVVHLRAGSLQISFVIRAELINPPENREDAVLAGLMTDRAALIRFLLLLMGSIDDAVLMLGSENNGFDGNWGSGVESFALLEPRLRTAAREPQRLEDIGRIMERLADQVGADVIPPDWNAVWDPIRIAMNVQAAQ